MKHIKFLSRRVNNKTIYELGKSYDVEDELADQYLKNMQAVIAEKPATNTKEIKK